jgi:hypothetical protein
VEVDGQHAGDANAAGANAAGGNSGEESPPTMADRMKMAQTLCAAHEMQMPILVDEVDDGAGKAYGAWPERAVLVDQDGTVVFASSQFPGPNPFMVQELEQALQAGKGL